MLEEPKEEGVLTAERVLRHAQAQGLQPVVDVRFSHRHLELCKRQGQKSWVRGHAGDLTYTPLASLCLGFSHSNQHPPTSQRTITALNTPFSSAITSVKRSSQKSPRFSYTSYQCISHPVNPTFCFLSYKSCISDPINQGELEWQHKMDGPEGCRCCCCPLAFPLPCPQIPWL